MLLSYLILFSIVAISLRLLSDYQFVHAPIATIACVLWIIYWRKKAEKTLNHKTTAIKVATYIAFFCLIYLLSDLTITSPLTISSKNFWLGRFEAIAVPIVIYSGFLRLSNSKKLPIILRCGIYSFTILLLGLEIAIFVDSLISPIEFSCDEIGRQAWLSQLFEWW